MNKDEFIERLKDTDLPKGEYVRGNETMELWRRLE